MTKTLKTLKALFVGSVIVSAISLITWMMLAIYAFFAHPESFFTTFHNFEPLKVAAPVLNTLTMVFMVIGFTAAAVAVMARKAKDCMIKK